MGEVKPGNDTGKGPAARDNTLDKTTLPSNDGGTNRASEAMLSELTITGPITSQDKSSQKVATERVFEPELPRDSDDKKADPREHLLEDVRVSETVRVRQNELKAVLPSFDRLLSQLPVPPEHDKPVEIDQVKEKVKSGQVEDLTMPELRAAIKLESTDSNFARDSGFKASEHANKLLNGWINHQVIDANVMLSAYQLRQRPGNPVGVPTIAVDSENPGSGYAARTETLDVLTASGQVDLAKVNELVKSGKLTTGLNLEPGIIPGTREITQMQNSMEFLQLNQGRIVEAHQRMEADGKYQILAKTLGIEKPGWQPPQETSDLSAYNARAGDAVNLVFQVRNYAEAVQSLNNIGGDFRSQALKDFPGELTWGGKDGKTITSMKLDLPDSLEPSPENERKFQHLKDWVEKYRGPVDQAMLDYEKGNFVRYGDVIADGNAGLDGAGNLVSIKAGDSANTTLTLINKEGKVFNRSLSGEMLDSSGGKPKVDELTNLADISKTEKFDYINQKFDVKTLPNGNIEVSSNRHYYQDHLLNYQHWFGDHVGDVGETRTYKPDDYVAVQTQTGKVEMVKADRLQEWKDVQAFFHHGGKIASTALDVGMIATGGMGAAGFVLKGAGTGLGFAANVGRVALGAGGLLDPTFRQMGETGEVLRQARHYAILLDVTQGLTRQGVGFLSGGSVLTYGKGAREVSKFIESTAGLKRIEQATRYAFGAADGVWMPLIYTGIRDKVATNSGDSSTQHIEQAYAQRGNGAGNLLASSFANHPAKDTVKPEEAARVTFDTYAATISGSNQEGTDQAKARFEKAHELIKDGSEQDRENARNNDLIKLFQASPEQLQNWRKTHENKSAHRATSFELGAVEETSTAKEKVAAAISLLFLANKDGALPEDGVLAKREVTVPGYQYQEVVYAGESSTTITRSVEAEKVEQKVTVGDVVKTLQDAALDSSDPATQMVATDALYRSGAITTGRYAAVCLDVLKNNNPSSDQNKELKIKALRQLSDLADLKGLEESDPASTGMDPTKYKAENYGFSKTEINEKLSALVKSESDPDIRAMGAAVLLAGDAPDRSSTITDYYEQWQNQKESPGAFHDHFVASLKEKVNGALPQSGDIKTFDQARDDKLRSALALRHLDGATGEGHYTDQINQALVETINFKGADADWYKWPSKDRPDLAITMQALNELIPSMDKLDTAARTTIQQTAIDVVRIQPEQINPRAQEAERIQHTEELRKAAQARLLVIGQTGSLFIDANQNISSKAKARQFEKAVVSDLSDNGIANGWGQYPEMRVASIRGLTALGTLENQSLGLIVNRLNFDGAKNSPEAFYERVPHVRSAALEALTALGKEDVLRNPTNYGLPETFNTEELLKRERDQANVSQLWNIWERDHIRPDPKSIEQVFNYQAEVAKMKGAVNTDGTIDDLMELARKQPEKFGLLNEKHLDEVAKQKAESSTWSWFGSEFAYWAIGAHDSTEEHQASTVEKPKLLLEKEEHFENLYNNFSQMTPSEQETTLKTFLHIIQQKEPKLFDKEHEADNIIDSAKYLEGLARQGQNNDIVKNKDLLGRVVVQALLKNETLDPRAKEHLLGAVDALTIKPGQAGFNEGSASDDYSVISPTRAGAIYTEVLSAELGRGAPNDRTANAIKTSSERVQLEAINKIHALRYHGAYTVLAAAGPDKRLDATNSGSAYDSVRERAYAVRDSLLNGTGWIYNDSPESLTASAGERAAVIEDALISGKTNNYQEAVASIFKAMKGQDITTETDLRRKALEDGLHHPSSRVKLASAWMLSQSAIDSDVGNATKVLADLAVNATEPAIQKEATGLLTAMIQDGSKESEQRARDVWQKAYDQRKDTNHPSSRPPAETSELEEAQNWYQKASNPEKRQVEALSPEAKKALLMQLTGMDEVTLEYNLIPPPVMDRQSLGTGFLGQGMFANNFRHPGSENPLLLLNGRASTLGGNRFKLDTTMFNGETSNINGRYQPDIRSPLAGDNVLTYGLHPELRMGRDGKIVITMPELSASGDSKSPAIILEPPTEPGSERDLRAFVNYMAARDPEYLNPNSTKSLELVQKYRDFIDDQRCLPPAIHTDTRFNGNGRPVLSTTPILSTRPHVLSDGRRLSVSASTVEGEIANWVEMKSARLDYRNNKIDQMLHNLLSGSQRTVIDMERPVWKPALGRVNNTPDWLSTPMITILPGR